MPSLSWRHHTLIQALLSRGPLEEQEFHSIFTGVTGENPGTHQQIFNDYLLKINEELSFVQMELRACRNQYDGSLCYGVVNNVADEQSKLGTRYTVPQIAFYKGIIDAIAHDGSKGSITNIDALNIRLENQVPIGSGSQSQDPSAHVPPAFKNFTMSQKEKTLEELVRDQWLCSTPDGNIGLGLRSFLELPSWFRDNDIPACEVCNEAGVKADLCPNKGCTIRIHQYCLKKTKEEKVCPGCSTLWPLPVFKAEAVEEEDVNTNVVNQSQMPLGPASQKRARTCGGGDSSALLSISSQPPVPASDVKRATRSSSQPPVPASDVKRATRSSSRLR